MKKNSGRKETKKYLFLAIVLLLLFLAFKIIQPFLLMIISSFILTYLIYPVYQKLNKKLGKTFSAILSTLLVFLVIALPLGAVIGGITTQAHHALESENIGIIIEKISSLEIIEKLNINLDIIFEKAIMVFVEFLGYVISLIPNLILSSIILLLGVYYMLLNFDTLSKDLKKYIPFGNKAEVAKEMANTTKGIIYGFFLIALIQFVVSMIGFYLIGVSAYFLLPALIFFMALIPGFGPTLIWVPATIYYLFFGEWFIAIGILIIGLVLSIYVDTILRYKIVGNKANINPFIMLIGVLGGIFLFGVFGLIIGPLILIYSIKLIKEFIKD